MEYPEGRKNNRKKKKDILVHSIDDSYPHEIHKKYLMVETKKKKANHAIWYTIHWYLNQVKKKDQNGGKFPNFTQNGKIFIPIDGNKLFMCTKILRTNTTKTTQKDMLTSTK